MASKIDEAEQVDVVDENDDILYPVPKAEAHEKGLLHRTVIAEIRDSEGRWVLIKQAPHKQDPGQFVSPVGGHVKLGETEDDALKREVLEEAGLSDFEFRLIGKTIFNRKVIGRHENHYFIVYEVFSDSEVVLNHESAEARRFTEEELRRELRNNPDAFGPAFYVILKEFYPHMLEN